MQKYKVDWLAFTISFEEHDGDIDENIRGLCDSKQRDFWGEIPGRYHTVVITHPTGTTTTETIYLSRTMSVQLSNRLIQMHNRGFKAIRNKRN